MTAQPGPTMPPLAGKGEKGRGKTMFRLSVVLFLSLVAYTRASGEETWVVEVHQDGMPRLAINDGNEKPLLMRPWPMQGMVTCMGSLTVRSEYECPVYVGPKQEVYVRYHSAYNGKDWYGWVEGCPVGLHSAVGEEAGGFVMVLRFGGLVPLPVLPDERVTVRFLHDLGVDKEGELPQEPLEVKRKGDVAGCTTTIKRFQDADGQWKFRVDSVNPLGETVMTLEGVWKKVDIDVLAAPPKGVRFTDDQAEFFRAVSKYARESGLPRQAIPRNEILRLEELPEDDDVQGWNVIRIFLVVHDNCL